MPNLQHLTPIVKADEMSRLNVNIGDEPFIYFFRKIFAGDRLARLAMCQRMFAAVHAECLRRGIPAEWDPASEHRVLEVLNDMFKQPEPKPTNVPARRTRKPAKS